MLTTYLGENWIYDAMIERQKKKGVDASQYLTPENVAEQMVALSDNFNPKDMAVLNACCGIGQLAGRLVSRGFNVQGFDSDADLVEVCKTVYPNAEFNQMDFRGVVSGRRWELVVANPPHEQKLLAEFMEWLSSALSANGKAILILPAGFLDKDKPAALVKILKRFSLLHNEPISESIPFTKTKNVICLVELSQEYKDLYKLEEVIINDNNTQDIQKEIIINKELEIMESEKEKTFLVKLADIKPNPDNPRKNIKETEIQELAQSIMKCGLLQPITLRPKADYFEIVCGERRYLAYTKNGETHIPAYIKELSDLEVMEMALAENLLRENLSPMEESNAFLRFIETGKYTVEDLVATFGKTEGYVRSRLRLQHLIDDFRSMLDNGAIGLNAGLELSKYDLKTQGNIFKEHFTADDNSNWKDLGVKELAGRIERAYTTDLSKYKFDKKECLSCQRNTGTYSLFSGPENGRCTDGECLNRKKSEYTLGCCKVLQEHYANMDICVTPYDKLDDDTRRMLEEQGIEVKSVMATDYPVAPDAPLREDFKTGQEYENAKEEYKIEVLAHNKEVDEIEAKIGKGELKRLIYIGDNNPKLCYMPVTADPSKDPLKALQQEDEANKVQAKNGVLKELVQLLKTCMLPAGAFSEFEEQMMFFFMLDCLNVRSYALFGIKDANLKGLPDDLKYRISKSLTPVQKAIIQRDFLVRHLVKAGESNAAATLLISFARQHFPQESEDISRKYTDSYNAKYQKIKKQIDKLKEKAEVANI